MLVHRSHIPELIWQKVRGSVKENERVQNRIPREFWGTWLKSWGPLFCHPGESRCLRGHMDNCLEVPSHQLLFFTLHHLLHFVTGPSMQWVMVTVQSNSSSSVALPSVCGSSVLLNSHLLLHYATTALIFQYSGCHFSLSLLDFIWPEVGPGIWIIMSTDRLSAGLQLMLRSGCDLSHDPQKQPYINISSFTALTDCSPFNVSSICWGRYNRRGRVFTLKYFD